MPRLILTMLIILILILVSGISLAQNVPQDTCRVEVKKLEYVSKVRIHTMTEQARKINNPVRWQPLQSIIADGALVKEGDVIATFVSKEAQYDLDVLQLRQRVIETQLSRRVSNIDNKNLDMSEQLDSLNDKLASLESKLERQKSEPTEDSIRIVEGRLRIAKMNLKAAEQDYAKAQDRFSREMISRTELESYESDLKDKRSKYIFAEQELEATKFPPERAADIRKTEIDIQVTKLEIERLEFETEQQLRISEIQKEGAVVNKRRNERRIKEKQEDIDKIIVKAPVSGYVDLKRFNNNEIVPGTRMWPNYVFMEMPELDTIGFKGILLESRRQFHAEGDKVLIYINGRKDKPLKGHLKSISTLSHDLAEKENAGWNRDKKFGVKVFDIIIALDDKADWLRPGMYGEADIYAKNPLEGAVLPLKYVRHEQDRYYVSIDGAYKEVTGTVVGGDFLLEDRELEGKVIGIGGVFEEKRKEEKEEKRLSASGELLPKHSTSIAVGDIGWWPWPKITWLQPEESFVKQGQVVAKLDPEERNKQVIDQDANVTEHRSRTDELERNVEITRRKGEFNVKSAQLNVESAQISLDKVKIIDPISLHNAEMNLALAENKLAVQKRKVERELAKKTPTVSPAELRKMKRELLRLEYKAEVAKLTLDEKREGATKSKRSSAQLSLSTAQDNLEIQKRQAAYDNLAVRREYERSKQTLKRSIKRLDYLKQQVENHNIVSPADGLLCYEKVYADGAITKVAVGNTVGRRFRILSIPDLSEMEMLVEVDEKYFSKVNRGMEVEVRLPSLNDSRLQGTVAGIELLFSNKAKKDSQLGLYSSHEPLGEVIFKVRINIHPGAVKLKPGLIGEVYFPINK